MSVLCMLTLHSFILYIMQTVQMLANARAHTYTHTRSRTYIEHTAHTHHTHASIRLL